jgi:hypothetical protein
MKEETDRMFSIPSKMLRGMQFLLAVMLTLAVGFAAVGVQAATTPNLSLAQRTTKYAGTPSDYVNGTYVNGDLNDNNSIYREGDCVPFELEMINLDPSTTTKEQVTIQWEHYRAGNYGYDSIGNFAVDLGSNGTIDLVDTDVTRLTATPDSTAISADQQLTVEFATGGATTATLYWCGVLAIPHNNHGGISSVSGAPIHMRVIAGAQVVGTTRTVYSVGNQDRSIQPKSVEPLTSTLATQQSATGVTTSNNISVTVGTVVTDTATLSQPNVNVGTMTFSLYKATATDSTCSTSTLVTTFAPITVANSQASTTYTPTSDGTYRWTVSYRGGAPLYADADSLCGSEILTVAKATTGISTAQGFRPNDSATLTGGTATAGGTLTFNLYGPTDPGCTGTPAFTQEVTVTSADNDTYATNNTTYPATATTPLPEGTYKWQVVYSGDGANAGITSTCGVEQFSIDNNTTN